MDQQIKDVASLIVSNADRFFTASQNQQRYLVAIAGRPGSGKTTIASLLSKTINKMYEAKKTLGEIQSKPESDALQLGDRQTINSTSDSITVVISLDGWHHPRSVLDQFDDPIEAHSKRGSPKTFDLKGYRKFVEQVLPSTDLVITAPSFSHSIKDPIQNAIHIFPSQRIVILEGLYTLLNDEADWRIASSLIHLAILINSDPYESKKRLIKRHLSSGICADFQQAELRVDLNDNPNGDYLLSHSRTPDVVIQSIDDPLLTEKECH